jgi:hypothetical protein
VVVLGKREVNRNRLRAGADFQFYIMVLHEQAELLKVVIAVQIRPGQRGFKTAWPGHKTIAELRDIGRFQNGAGHRIGVDADKRVAGAHMAGQAGTGHIALHGAAQMENLLVINGADLRQRGGRVSVAHRRDEEGQ